MHEGDGSTPFDYVIVGAGSAGCVVAARLSEDPSVSVLLLEAGPSDDVPGMDVPILAPRLLNGPYDWAFRTEPEPGLDGRVMTLNHGKVVGGSSSINSMVYLRGSASDFDEWRDAGAIGWGYQEVLPYFRRSEDNEWGAGQYHGAGGPLSVSDGRSRHPLSAVFVRAAQQAGYRLNDDLNGATQDGVGYPQVTQRGGRRCSVALAYLGPCRSQPNLTVLVEAQVTGLLFDGNRATGVRVTRGGRPAEFRADREVVLAAGAYGSPHLLLLAGIGPARHLEQMGVRVRQDLPAGRNLQDHLRVGLAFESRLPALDSEVTPAAFMRFAADGSGPVSSNVGETSGFIRSRPGRAAPDFQVNGVPAMIGGMLGVVADGVSVVGWPSKPTSSGHLELRSADPGAPPRIVHNYLTTAEDREISCDGMRRMREIAEQPAFREVAIGGPKAGPDDFTDDAILRYARATGMTTHHPCGTCGIGAVVDAELRVFGVEALRVADASVFPRITRSNTNAATIMVGEKAADLLVSGKIETIAAEVRLG
jgi:choline dehydrogenase-like flavoprotein